MNCRRFEESWNELLDSRLEVSSELERAMEAHASACARCRAVSARYQVLRQATSALRPPPGPSAGSIDRLHALRLSPTAPPSHVRIASRSVLVFWGPLASAAALFAVAWLGGFGGRSIDPVRTPDPAPEPPVVAARPLGMALAEAREATIDLARAASEPASWIGREMLNLRKVADSSTTEGGEADLEVEAAPSTPGGLRSVGERVTAGVGPISGSARHAFSFLLGPPPESSLAPRESHGSL